ncbi:hypothetical protein [Pseudomonas sp.]|uniref:hypothetical protein n=1 Tax=Pseudomonas sp. TaxID=306 RepID=UPI003CC6128C
MISVPRELLEQALRGDIPKPRLDENHCCIGCGSWMPYRHPEAHVHEEDCAEEVLAGESHWSTRFMDLLAQPNTCTKDGGQVAAPEPVMRLECEKLWGGHGEYAVDFVKPGWLKECREKGGTFLLYSNPPAQAPVVLPGRRSPKHTWNACIDEFKRLNPTL